MHSMKIKRQLPPAPKTATKTVRNDHLVGYGVYTYESTVPQTVMDLRIPPTRSNSQASQAEREMKIILDLAREGKTASEISAETGFNMNRIKAVVNRFAETGFNMNRIKAVVNRFAEYGAKLASEKKPKRRKAPKPLKDKRSSPRFWTDERTRVLINLHGQGVIYDDIAKQLGTTRGAVSSRVKRLIDEGVLEPRGDREHWTQEDINLLIELKQKGLSNGEISDRIGKSPKACAEQFRRKKC